MVSHNRKPCRRTRKSNLPPENGIIGEIGRIVGSTVNIDDIYEQFAAAVSGLIPFDRISITWINYAESTVKISYVFETVATGGRQKGDTFPLCGSISETIVKTRSGIIIHMDNREKVQALFPAFLEAFDRGSRTAMMAPLILRDKVIGTLYVRSRKHHAYRDRDLKVFESIGFQIAGAIANAQLFNEVKRTEERLRESEEKYRSIFENAAEGIYRRTPEGKILAVNPALARMHGYASPKEMLSEVPDEPGKRFFVDNNEMVRFMTLLETQGVVNGFEAQQYRKDGTTFWASFNIQVEKNAEGKALHYVGIVEDITARKKLEDGQRHAQKMEAIGTLAGGIAHDFNNMLAIIIGNAELAIDDGKHESVSWNLKQILNASKRSRDIIKQILTFSRKDGGQGKIVQIARLLEETHDMLRASIPSTIHMELNIRAKAETAVFADPSQFQQVVVNLANNAAYAMRENGGKLTMGLSTVTIPDSPNEDMKPGSYVKLTMKDTGTGIPPEVHQRMFEPFFTTKEQGQGTGMGLAVVYGIVKSCGGTVEVESEIGEGAKFTILLPQADAPLIEEKKEEALSCSQKEHILFIDDEEAVVKMTRIMLERIGYRITAVTGSSDALRVFSEAPYNFDLVITDQTMPDMTGIALAKEVLAIREGMPIILCTGYSETVSPEKAKEVGIRESVMKPITKKEMAHAIRRVLERGKGIK